MIRRLVATVVLMSALLGPSPGLAGVKVRFINPERYTDADSFGGASREVTLAEFRAYLETLGRRLLAPGQNLSIDVLDIDLAGQDEPRGRGTEVRVMRDVTPPRIKLRYTLSGGGRRTTSGEDDLSDMNYLMNSSGRLSGRYGYEKALLDDWFRRIAGSR
ncbi:DUF3016 domain-containing protein [Bradyrhizobium iriomotense]|nr:DUF3016 domain-containing protein [Bradyrhizobium iriomotense]